MAQSMPVGITVSEIKFVLIVEKCKTRNLTKKLVNFCGFVYPA